MAVRLKLPEGMGWVETNPSPKGRQVALPATPRGSVEMTPFVVIMETHEMRTVRSVLAVRRLSGGDPGKDLG